MLLFDMLLQSYDNNNWNYYKMWFKNNPFENPELSKAFILEYFQKGSKKNVFDSKVDINKNLVPMRAVHTISTFFLGILIYERLFENGDLDINTQNYTFPFPYLWFLVCLYHDIGYCIEENIGIQVTQAAPIPSNKSQLTEYRALSQLKKTYDIKYSLYYNPRFIISQHQKERHYPILSDRIPNDKQEEDTGLYYKLMSGQNIGFNSKTKIKFNNQSCTTIHKYNSITVTRYFNYCVNTIKKYNHGVIGGYLFFDRILKNYIDTFKKYITQGGNNDITEFVYNNRLFCRKQLPIFSYVADCIIAHNIWKGKHENPSDVENYKKYKIESLLEDNYETISLANNPLLFILCIADTVEPYKVFSEELDFQETLKNINLEYQNSTKTFTFTTTYKNGDTNKKWIDKIKELPDWTSVEVREIDSNKICLTL